MYTHHNMTNNWCIYTPTKDTIKITTAYISVLDYLLREDSSLENLTPATASTTTVFNFAATIQTLGIVNKARSVQLPIHSLKKQKVAPIRELIILVRIRVVHAITHISVPKVFIPMSESKPMSKFMTHRVLFRLSTHSIQVIIVHKCDGSYDLIIKKHNFI
mmetsp:Transcript_7970/g.12097  ORF Transcript_7970/g.12097 Transcript_7970/m.12097 type:complete len:161 (+) Transcript_7970:2161-2643(+)